MDAWCATRVQLRACEVTRSLYGYTHVRVDVDATVAAVVAAFQAHPTAWIALTGDELRAIRDMAEAEDDALCAPGAQP